MTMMRKRERKKKQNVNERFAAKLIATSRASACRIKKYVAICCIWLTHQEFSLSIELLNTKLSRHERFDFDRLKKKNEHIDQISFLIVSCLIREKTYMSSEQRSNKAEGIASVLAVMDMKTLSEDKSP